MYYLSPLTLLFLDVVLWDSHPLALGATPQQVWIDGIAQLESPYVTTKPASFQKAPIPPNFDKEAADAVKYEGLPPLEPKQTDADVVVFTNVRSLFTKQRGTGSIREVFSATHADGMVVVEKGRVVCIGACPVAGTYSNAETIDLSGGSISSVVFFANIVSFRSQLQHSPGLIAFGSALGLEHISGEGAPESDPYHSQN